MAYSIRTRNVVTPRPSINGLRGTPFFTGSLGVGIASSNTAMTVNTGYWGGIRNTFAYQWYFNASTVVAGSSASMVPASVHRGSTMGCTVTVTNPYGTKAVAVTAIAIL